MSSPSGKNRPDLIDHLLTSPCAYEFVQAMRLLYIRQKAQNPLAPPEVESSGSAVFRPPPRPIAARFLASASLAYPATQIAAAPDNDGLGEVPTFAMNFLGLHGPSGVLPAYVTQAVASAGRDNALTQILDFFNDRLADAFWRVSRASRVALLLEEDQPVSAAGARPDLLSRSLLSIGGRPTRRSRGSRAEIYHEQLARYFAATWRQQPVKLTALQSILRYVLKAGVQVLPFEPSWCRIDPASRFRLGRTGRSPASRVLGHRVRQTQCTVLVRIGPLGLRSFRRLLPGRIWLGELGRLLRSTMGSSADFVVQPILRADEVPRWRLGARSSCNEREVAPALLGRAMFLGRYDPARGDFAGLKLASAVMDRSLSRPPCAPCGQSCESGFDF